MPAPSLTLARRLYARKYRALVRDVGAYSSHSTGSKSWFVQVSLDPSRYFYATAKTESAALRKLCRALGWRP